MPERDKCLAKLKNKLVWFPTFAESVRMALDNLWIVERVKSNPPYKKCSANLNQIFGNGGFSNRVFWDISSSEYQ